MFSWDLRKSMGGVGGEIFVVNGAGCASLGDVLSQR